MIGTVGEGPIEALRRHLLEPALVIGVEEISATWRLRMVRVVVDRMHDFDTWPELPVRIRGAFGRALYHRLPRTDRRGQVSVPAVSALFDHSAWLDPRLEIGKPFVLRAWPQDDCCIVELRLFGMADQWLDDAVDALLDALKGGIALKAERSFRVPMRVLDVLTSASGGLPEAPRASSAVMKFRAPVAVRRHARHVFHPLSVVASVVKRVESLASWQGVSLGHDRARLRAVLDELSIDDRDMTPYRWERHSIRGGDQAIGVGGLIGDLRLSGNLAPLVPYLQIAETCNTGSHAALGLGWFDLVLYP